MRGHRILSARMLTRQWQPQCSVRCSQHPYRTQMADRQKQRMLHRRCQHLRLKMVLRGKRMLLHRPSLRTPLMQASEWTIAAEKSVRKMSAQRLTWLLRVYRKQMLLELVRRRRKQWSLQEH